jgi:hypothetical protein
LGRAIAACRLSTAGGEANARVCEELTVRGCPAHRRHRSEIHPLCGLAVVRIPCTVICDCAELHGRADDTATKQAVGHGRYIESNLHRLAALLIAHAITEGHKQSLAGIHPVKRDGSVGERCCLDITRSVLARCRRVPSYVGAAD